eukprot:TRINITY_DN9590_c0_g1_i1.p1 TRINITY_DN9590_c0_g1~~TRINITY_DN9590_c0_g1_i1.p1  ORF type:complete len:470 (+),score=112.42 TRINITY_DN9590_c0_g1_i1:50-1411(+)
MTQQRIGELFSLHFFDQLPPLRLWKESKAAERVDVLPKERDVGASSNAQANVVGAPKQTTVSNDNAHSTTLPTTTSSQSSSSSSTGVSWLENADKMKEFAEFGLPVGGNPFLIAREGYVVSFDWRTRNAHWVFQHVRGNSSTQVAERKNIQFQEDALVPELFRSLLSDYRGSGFDRGHLAPAADMRYSENAMLESFYLTNISPQVGEGFNRDYWARFEKFTRDLSKRFGAVQIITGPLFLPEKHPTQPGKHQVRYEVIGHPPNVAVPTHFFKAVLVEEKPVVSKALTTTTTAPVSSSEIVPLNKSNAPNNVNNNNGDVRRFLIAGFILPNAAIPENDPIQKYMVPIDHIEKASGLILWPDLPQVKYNLTYKPPTSAIPSTTTPETSALPAPSSGETPSAIVPVAPSSSTELTSATNTTKMIQAFNLCMAPEQLCKLPPPNWFLRTDNKPTNSK